MNADQYKIIQSDRCTLVRTIGTRDIPIISDTNPEDIQEIYQKIRNHEYVSEQALHDDIYSRYKHRSIFQPV